MPVNAYYDNYKGEVKDRVENFHGNQLVYINWDKHLLFAAPFTLVAPPSMTFGDFLKNVVPGAFNQHPEWEKIDWAGVNWLLDGETFTPQPEKSLIDQGIKHKSFLRLQTPAMTGIAGAGI